MRFISHQAPISFPGDTFGSADKIPMLQHSARCGDNQFMQAPYQKWMNKGWMHSRRGINKRSYFHSPEAGPFSLWWQKKRWEPRVACNGPHGCPDEQGLSEMTGRRICWISRALSLCLTFSNMLQLFRVFFTICLYGFNTHCFKLKIKTKSPNQKQLGRHVSSASGGKF